jgi:hypothetical protein
MTRTRAVRFLLSVDVAVLLSLAPGASAQPAPTAPTRLLVHAGTLIDGRAEAPRREVTIVVEGERIADVVPGYRPAATGETVLDPGSTPCCPAS